MRSCQACQSIRNAPATVPLHPWLWPTKPWQRIHIDFVGPFIDAHSKWPEMMEMRSTTAYKTVEELQKLCMSYGQPEQVVSDNGPQFVFDEFAKFVRLNGIKHIKNAPYHPYTNGATERLIQTFKKTMKASERDGHAHAQRLASFLLIYRSMPHLTTPETPSELFLKRST